MSTPRPSPSPDGQAMWDDLTPEEQLGQILDHFPAPAWAEDAVLSVLALFYANPLHRLHINARGKAIGVNTFDLSQACKAIEARHAAWLKTTTNGTSPGSPGLPPPETATALLAADIPAPLHLFEGLLHEGMLLLGGKSKRGKSWLMFDLALSLAVGRSAFQHFACPAPQPVLYLALEDGRARLQGRLRLIQPNLQQADNLHLRYTFPPLSEGGVEALAAEIQRYHYGLVVIDVLAKLETAGKGTGEKGYHEVYEMFAPLQKLRNEQPFCLAMLTHLRKQEAEDSFDSLHGSVAYQGAQDVLWVLERKPKDEFAFLHIRDKDAEDKTIALRFFGGHWEYIGEGEEYEVSRDQRKVVKVLAEEKREMTIQEIMKAVDFPEQKYAYARKLLMTMVKDDLIHRTRQGRYSATIRAAVEMELDDEKNEQPPF